MLSDVASFLRYFEGVHRRTVRDVGALPPDAETWKPPPPPHDADEESAWGVPEIVRHIAEARLFFASAFAGPGWVWDPWPDRLEARSSWVPALQTSLERFRSTVEPVPAERLRARVEALDGEGASISAWRTLMMMVEHEVHHRSQIETYAGLNGWPVNQIFGRTYESVVAQLEGETSAGPPEA